MYLDMYWTHTEQDIFTIHVLVCFFLFCFLRILKLLNTKIHLLYIWSTLKILYPQMSHLEHLRGKLSPLSPVPYYLETQAVF